jgi:hypothetical protein
MAQTASIFQGKNAITYLKDEKHSVTRKTPAKTNEKHILSSIQLAFSSINSE